MGEDKKRDKTRHKKRETKPLPIVYEDEDERRRERERSAKRSETGTSSHHHSSHASSRRTQDPSEGSTTRRSESQNGTPLSRSALHSYKDPNTAKSEVASIASISSRGHKSGTVVAADAAWENRHSNKDYRAESDADVERARQNWEKTLGSHSQAERSKKISDYANKMTEYVPQDRLAAAAADIDQSRAATAKRQDPLHTRESRDGRHHTRSRSEATSSRRFHSTAPRERTSSRTHESITKITFEGDANLTIHDHDDGTTTRIISRTSGRKHHAPQPPSFSSHSGDTTRYHHAPAPPPQPLKVPRIQELGSVTASSYGSSSYGSSSRDSEITARPSRSGSGLPKPLPIKPCDWDVKTVNTSEAASFMGSHSVARGAYIEPTSSFYETETRRPSWVAPSVVSSSSRPVPPPSSYPLVVRSRGGDSRYTDSVW
ncbi:uncharacterized protein EAE97_010679 [Botrytis byssoidea]|uniref:Uncharacterized protein n=1 Tax=Botrytis byssoidea TaxID=139641 RepID=A0A9P5HW84_9HELO|nr:uncharacterized protein EAE97_010679 [Botrytis byssoidea]KAF7924728.1 hypothetical protein EAE97_010679 [Botrytis byssoidea]